MSFALSLYRGAGWLAAPILKHVLRRRISRGKEDPARQNERFGIAERERPKRTLIWVHAASVGEALSALPLIRAITERGAATLLITTGTLTSAQMISARAPDVIHQFVPIDTPLAVRRFLDHWKPDLALWIESELWPTLVTETARRGIPLALVNGRISKRSARNWGWARGAARAVMGAFDLRLVQSDAVRSRLLALGVAHDSTVVTGDIKASRPAESPDEQALATMREAVGKRPVWLAASTHPGEEEAVAAAHATLAKRAPDLLTIIAPRHPERGSEIAASLAGGGFDVSQRSTGDPPAALYIADTLGEMPLWYALAPIAFIGGGWGVLGGHNPLEAAQARTAIISGPRVANFFDIYERLQSADALRFAADAAELPEVLLTLTDEMGRPNAEARRMADAALAAGSPDAGPLDRTMDALTPLLERAFR